MNEELCQSCGTIIPWHSPAIAIRYGKIRANTRFTQLTKEYEEYFHASCQIAQRKNKEVKP